MSDANQHVRSKWSKTSIHALTEMRKRAGQCQAGPQEPATLTASHGQHNAVLTDGKHQMLTQNLIYIVMCVW
eukprot:scaffold229103_cov22-Prasinocladus_malaysianus.AAC.1